MIHSYMTLKTYFDVSKIEPTVLNQRDVVKASNGRLLRFLRTSYSVIEKSD